MCNLARAVKLYEDEKKVEAEKTETINKEKKQEETKKEEN